MEMITAAFRTRSDLEQAAAVLRRQGAVDIVMNGVSDGVEISGIKEEASMLAPAQEETACTLQVVVESSRFRQAEDTIVKYGGRM